MMNYVYKHKEKLGEHNLTISAGGQEFCFTLYRRPVQVAEGLWIRYFWIDTRCFRPGKRSGPWRKMVDFHWALAVERNLGPEEMADVECIRILSELYPVILPRKAAQVFDDGRPRFVKDEDDMNLLEHLLEVQEAGGVSAERYCAAMKRLSSETPVHPGTQKILEEALGFGRAALYAGDGEYFDIFRKNVGDRLRKEMGRKIRPGRKIDVKAKDFVAGFSFQVEVAFHAVYAQTWSYLIGEIERQLQPSRESIDFLKLWHMNQDNFALHVFALHPISGIIMSEPMLLRLMEPWLRDPESEAGQRMLTAIVTLALENFGNLKEKEMAKRGINVFYSDPTELDNL